MRRYLFRKALGNGGRLRAWRAMGAQIDDDVRIGPGVTMRTAGNVSIAAGSALNGRIFIDAWGRVTIGRCCLINDHVDLLTAQHDLDSADFAGDIREISIGDYVWL